jgi:hypothetical protein
MQNIKSNHFIKQMIKKGLNMPATEGLKAIYKKNKLSAEILNDIDGPCGAGQSHTNHSAHANHSKSNCK